MWQRAVHSPWTTVSEKQESQSYKCKEINSTNNLRSLETGLFLVEPLMRTQTQPTPRMQPDENTDKQQKV